jgi:soluble P-type ATPase
MKIDIASYDTLELESLVLDYNGTIALDGRIGEATADTLKKIAKFMKIYVLTADTFGTVSSELEALPLELRILQSDDHSAEKAAFVESLGAERCAVAGNGNNDALMLERAALSIAVMGREGCAVATLLRADIVCGSTEDMLELFLNIGRIKATLRR